MTGSNATTATTGVVGQIVPRIADLARSPLPEAAMGFAASGVPVFPCVPGQKRPLTAHGLLDASVDMGQVRSWWQRWPSANIGLPTGQTSGLDVLDIDVRTDGSGFEAFNRVRSLGLADGWAMLVRTPSGGMHAYYPATPGQSQRCWQAADAHLDFRGDGGYVIAPPSTIAQPDGTARRYVVSVTAAHQPSPVDADRIRDLLIARPVQPARGRPEPRGVGADADRLAAWVAARGEGERNRGLFWAACRLAERGAVGAEIEDALGTAAQGAGLAPAEIAATIRSATRTAARDTAVEPNRQSGPTPLHRASPEGGTTPRPLSPRNSPAPTR